MAALQINPIRRIIAVLKLPKAIASAIAKARLIVSSMTGNAHFPIPSPALATVTTHIDELEAAETEAQKRTQGAAEARNVALAVVAEDLRDLTAYVQQIADATPASSEAIIQSAGLQVKQVTSRTKPDFEVKNDKVSGTVLLIAKSAGNRTSHDWQSSNNGSNFTALPSTIQAKTKVSGLTPASRMYFRHRLVTKDGPQSWSQTVSIVVT